MKEKAIGIVNNEEIVITIGQQDSPESPREWENIGTMICFPKEQRLGDEHPYTTPHEFLEDLAEQSRHTNAYARAMEEIFQEHFRYEVTPCGDSGYEITTDMADNLFEGECFDTEEEATERLLNEKSNWMENDALRVMTFSQLETIIEEDFILLPLYLFEHGGQTMNTIGFSCSWDSGQVGYIYASKQRFREETGYKENELFSTDAKREPHVGERVLLKNQTIHQDASCESERYGLVTAKEEGIITVNFDYNKIQSYRKPEHTVKVSIEEVEKVMSERAKQMLISEVDIYDQYLKGEVYYFNIEKKSLCNDGQHAEYERIESSSGFYGSNPFENGMEEYIDADYHEILKQLA